MDKENENGLHGGFHFHRPVKKTKWESLRTAIYDPSSNRFCGRTPKSWGQLFAFYAVFYLVLAALFAICMQGLLATIDPKEPKWQQERSLIGTNPGLGFRPISEITEEGSLIWYNPSNVTNRSKWTKLLDEFLDPYINNQTGKDYVSCNSRKYPNGSQVCITDPNNFGPCGPEDKYGYDTPSPCIFLKLNRIFGWEPKFYLDPLEEMPQDLNDTITSKIDVADRQQIWVSCEGESPIDKENLHSFQYYPSRGFPGYYYPFKSNPKYLSPLIAVRVINPTANIIINIECRAWAENIYYNGGNLRREGSVHFEILCDSVNA